MKKAGRPPARPYQAAPTKSKAYTWDASTRVPVKVSPAQIRRLWAIVIENKYSYKEVFDFVRQRWGSMNPEDFTLPQYNEICDHFAKTKGSR